PGSQYLVEDRATTQQLDPVLVAIVALVEEIHPPNDSLARIFRHGRMHIVLVHHGDVVENILLLGEHATHAVLDDDHHFITEGGVVATRRGNDGIQNVAVPVAMLQSLAIERGST